MLLKTFVQQGGIYWGEVDEWGGRNASIDRWKGMKTSFGGVDYIV